MSNSKEIICRICSTEFNTKYCPNCGNPAFVKRINSQFVWEEIKRDLIHFEEEFFFTIKQLLTNPGHALRRYIKGERFNYYRPVKFLLLSSVVYSLLNYFLETKTTQALSGDNMEKIFQWLQIHYNYTNLTQIFILAFLLKWFFRKTDYTYFEKIILLFYLTGFEMLISGILSLISYLTGEEMFAMMDSLIALLFNTWAFSQFYESRHWWTYTKAVLVQIVGLVILIVLGILLSLGLDFLKVKL